MRGRVVALDTETTGLSPKDGHRIVEFGAVVLQDGIPTKEVFHRYINPGRSMPDEAFQVHGLSEEFLQKYPLFEAQYQDIQNFLQDSPLVIHNAAFDTRFLNAELKRVGQKELDQKIIDTLRWARRLFPGAPASLDALCRRFRIDATAREKHGALVDAQLLAHVYGCLINWEMGKNLNWAGDTSVSGQTMTRKKIAARDFPLNQAEQDAYQEFLNQWSDAKWHQCVDNS